MLRNILIIFVMVVISGAVQAHDFWLIPESFSPKSGQTIKIAAHTGDRFPEGDSPVTPDRLARFEIHSARGKTDITPFRAGAKWSEAEVGLREPGSYVIAVELKPRPIQLEAGKFNEYLAHEGLSRILELRAKAKKENSEGREVYAKYAKSIIHVGNKRDSLVTRPVGLKLEIVPERDPLTVLPGEKLPVRILFNGSPLANAQVASVSEGHGGKEDYSDITRTSYQGIALIPITRPGACLVRLVHMIAADEAMDHEWESFFSTLTFRIPTEKAFPLTVDSIMRGEQLVGNGISQIRWAGDSSRVYFGWHKPGEKEPGTYVLPREGGAPRKLSEQEAKAAPPAAGGHYSKDRKKVVFEEDGDLILQDTISGARTQLLRTQDLESSPRFTKDEKHLTFVRNNNLYRLSLATPEIIQLTDIRPGPEKRDPKVTESQKFLQDQQKELFEVVRERAKAKEEADAKKKEREKRKPYYLPQRATVSGFALSPEENLVVFSQSERAEQAKQAIVPNYVTETGYTEDIQSRVKVGDAQGKSSMGLLSVETGEVTWIDPGLKDRSLTLFNPLWSEDGRNLLVTGIADDRKDRWFFLVDLKTGKTRVLENLHDDAWVAGSAFGGSSVGWMPDGRSIYFVAEKDGYLQLYVAGIDGSGAKPLTTGKFEVSTPFLSEDKSRFYFTSSEEHPGERHFYSMSIRGGARTRLTSMSGSNQATLSPDEKTAALVYSYSNKPPELYLMENKAGAKANQITTTPTEEWRSFPWVDPKLITFKARDGVEVYARVYTPEILEAARSRRVELEKSSPPVSPSRRVAPAKRPGVIFVHGAGYLQNVHRYWSSYYREFMFHHILMDRGYVVMDIDYRASSGYGRDWRTAIYGHMGGKDLEDQVDGARWMIENLNVDARRIGIYGGSYGGFITLMAMFTAPETFAAGAALRPVTDWAHYNHPYTSNILEIPQKDAGPYTRSSPIYFAEGLKGALLICHGMVDVNVHFQDTVRLVERLIELRKENWESAIYPVEDHAFRRSDSWADEYKRILKLFEQNLKVKEPGARSQKPE